MTPSNKLTPYSPWPLSAISTFHHTHTQTQGYVFIFLLGALGVGPPPSVEELTVSSATPGLGPGGLGGGWARQACSHYLERALWGRRGATETSDLQRPAESGWSVSLHSKESGTPGEREDRTVRARESERQPGTYRDPETWETRGREGDTERRQRLETWRSRTRKTKIQKATEVGIQRKREIWNHKTKSTKMDRK